MTISIRPTLASEAEELASIQKKAFFPLYEKYHDEGNPYLRGAEDILRRLNDSNRYFTKSFNNRKTKSIIKKGRTAQSTNNTLDSLVCLNATNRS